MIMTTMNDDRMMLQWFCMMI